MATYADLNANMQSQAGAQLRTFEKIHLWQITVYIRVYGTDNIYGGVMGAQDGPSGTVNLQNRFWHQNVNDNVYNNYLDSGIYSGNIIYSQDVIDSISNVLTRTISQIENLMTDRDVSALLCHNSCHSSCHTSRGRR